MGVQSCGQFPGTAPEIDHPSPLPGLYECQQVVEGLLALLFEFVVLGGVPLAGHVEDYRSTLGMAARAQDGSLP